jgi:hypothetical protein
MLPAAEQQRICEARRKTGWGPRQLAGRLGHPHATISKALPWLLPAAAAAAGTR